jgi:hypothetical protein
VAIRHLTVKCMSRSKGQSETAAAAYWSAQKIRNEHSGELHYYSRKGGVLHRAMVTRECARSWARNRERLWNAAEASETRNNSTVAREFEIALPAELKAHARTRLAVDFARAIATKHRGALDVSVEVSSEVTDTDTQYLRPEGPRSLPLQVPRWPRGLPLGCESLSAPRNCSVAPECCPTPCMSPRPTWFWSAEPGLRRVLASCRR